MTTVIPMDKWQEIAWKKVERNVFKLQKRIYQASNRDDMKSVRKLPAILSIKNNKPCYRQ